MEVKFDVLCRSVVGGASACVGWDVDCGSVCLWLVIVGLGWWWR